MQFDLNSVFSVVDIETTGQRADDGAIIEIGIVHVRKGVIVDHFQSLVNPAVPISTDITFLTGIRTEDVWGAPSFKQLWPQIKNQLAGSYFVAHNAEFDYGFIKTECARIDEPFYMDRFCTVKLSRKLLPEVGRYNLDALASHLDIPIKNRHRALDDAMATAEILTCLLQQKEAGEVFRKFAAKFEQSAKWAERLAPHLSTIPHTTGVYQFKDVYDLPLYIGKSRNMYARILSHLREDDIPRKKKLIHHTDHFETIECGTELEALILESRLIKKHQPHFNIELTRRKGYVFVKVTRDEYPKMYIVKEKKIDEAVYVGPFQASKFAEYLLQNLQKHFKLCPELMKERRNRSGLCFAYHLHQCDGACGKKIAPEQYRSRVEEVMDLLHEFTRLDSTKSIDQLLKTRELRKTEWSPFRNTLKRIKSTLKEIPGFLDQRLLLVHADDGVGYLIVGGTLRKIYRGDEINRLDEIHQEAMAVPLESADTEEVLDQRLTIQRYISANRSRLQLYSLKHQKDPVHATH